VSPIPGIINYTTQFKGIVRLKMKILSLFTHPEVVSTCMRVFLLLNTKEYILKNVGNQTVDGHHGIFPYYVSQWGQSNA